MKEKYLSKRERRKFIFLFSQLSKSQLQEIKSIVERELKNKVLLEHGKELKNEKRSIFSRILSKIKSIRTRKG